MANVKAVPDGFHTVTPALTVRTASKAIEFYKKAFGAKEMNKYLMPDGRIMHAALKIGNSVIFLMDEMPEMRTMSPETMGGTPVSINIYVEDPDVMFNRAVKVGAKVGMPMADQFWGDRSGQVIDPFGYRWSINAHVRDVSEKEMEKAGREMVEKMVREAKQAKPVQKVQKR